MKQLVIRAVCDLHLASHVDYLWATIFSELHIGVTSSAIDPSPRLTCQRVISVKVIRVRFPLVKKLWNKPFLNHIVFGNRSEVPHWTIIQYQLPSVHRLMAPTRLGVRHILQNYCTVFQCGKFVTQLQMKPDQCIYNNHPSLFKSKKCLKIMHKTCVICKAVLERLTRETDLVSICMSIWSETCTDHSFCMYL